jgi:hypothetical protein
VILGVLTLVTAVVAIVLWLNGETGTIVLSPVYAFGIWALVREIDPDHHWTALVGAGLAALWALTGGNVFSVFALAGLALASRIATSTTGRQPLPTDLLGVAVFGIGIGFTVEGWVAGFGIALAIYLDDRFAERSRLVGVGASAATAIGTTVVATLTSAFPERLPDIDQGIAIAAGVTALVLLVREPESPISQVDARHAAFIERGRLHASRSLVGVLTFLMAVLAGVEADGLIVVIAALILVIGSNEVELLRRRNL